MFPTLTETRCGCCGVRAVDDVALAAVCDGVRAFRDASEALRARDREAWADAEAQMQAALAARG